MRFKYQVLNPQSNRLLLATAPIVVTGREEKKKRKTKTDTEGEQEQQWQREDERQWCHELGGSGMKRRRIEGVEGRWG